MNGRHCKDRITNLPTSLITKILSCLPTKEAVATCVLSTKWKRSWTFITNLDFSDHKSMCPMSIDYDNTIRKFTSFVTRALLLRDGSFLQCLRMTFLQAYEEPLFFAWLIAAVHCNIQELDLNIGITPPGQLPVDIFLCRTLVNLKLHGRSSGLNMPTSTCLPALKTLQLSHVRLSDDVSIISLLSGCPVLEELRLMRCVGKDVRVVKISGHFLKILSIGRLSYDYSKDHPKYQIVIDTPALEYFNFSDNIAKGYLIIDMNHLIEATIDFNYRVWWSDLHSEDITNLLSGISYVQTLVLSIDSIMVLGRCDRALPNFCSLTYLEIHWPGNSQWRFLAEIIVNSPYLETFKILQGNWSMWKEPLDIFPFRDVPSCFRSHLKMIKIVVSSYDNMEMEVFKYILKNAQVLEKLTVCKPHYLKVDAELIEKLQSLPRGSPICDVVFA